LAFVILSFTLEAGIGIIYGVAVGYDPLIVFPTAIILNFLALFVAVFIVDRLMDWKKGIRIWIEKRLGRGQKLIDKYGYIGIFMGILVLSPIQLAILGRLVGIKPSKLYPTLFAGIVVVATFFLGAALGIFKVLLQ
jgi:hypothetical protein